MRILAVSDHVEPALHGRFDPEPFRGTRLIVSCGDLPPEYLTHLTRSLNAPLYYVRGNHDIRYDSKPPEACTDLHARSAAYGNLRLAGLEGSHWYNGGPHQYTEGQMRTHIRALRPGIRRLGGVDVVITHAPPLHVHDSQDPCHRGFKSFRRLIDRYSPRYFIHGHIHARFTDPGERITMVHNTKVVNAYGHFLFDIGDEYGAD